MQLKAKTSYNTKQIQHATLGTLGENPELKKPNIILYIQIQFRFALSVTDQSLGI